jgi:hypothetical protein
MPTGLALKWLAAEEGSSTNRSSCVGGGLLQVQWWELMDEATARLELRPWGTVNPTTKAAEARAVRYRAARKPDLEYARCA